MVTIPNRAASTRAYAITAEGARPAAAGAAAGQIPAASVPSRWTSAVNASVIRGADAGDIVLQYSQYSTTILVWESGGQRAQTSTA
ncbi:hypothetical protein ACVWZ8_001028 [Arthrobacter sp. UYCu723]